MSKMFWDPKTGIPTTYADDETPPEGHLDTHPDNPRASTSSGKQWAAPTPGPVGGNDPLDKPLTRTETIAGLTAGGIVFDTKATAVALHDLLRDNLLAVLKDVEGVVQMSTRRLLLEVEK